MITTLLKAKDFDLLIERILDLALRNDFPEEKILCIYECRSLAHEYVWLKKRAISTETYYGEPARLKIQKEMHSTRCRLIKTINTVKLMFMV